MSGKHKCRMQCVSGGVICRVCRVSNVLPDMAGVLVVSVPVRRPNNINRPCVSNLRCLVHYLFVIGFHQLLVMHVTLGPHVVWHLCFHLPSRNLQKHKYQSMPGMRSKLRHLHCRHLQQLHKLPCRDVSIGPPLSNHLPYQSVRGHCLSHMRCMCAVRGGPVPHARHLPGHDKHGMLGMWGGHFCDIDWVSDLVCRLHCVHEWQLVCLHNMHSNNGHGLFNMCDLQQPLLPKHCLHKHIKHSVLARLQRVRLDLWQLLCFLRRGLADHDPLCHQHARKCGRRLPCADCHRIVQLAGLSRRLLCLQLEWVLELQCGVWRGHDDSHAQRDHKSSEWRRGMPAPCRHRAVQHAELRRRLRHERLVRPFLWRMLCATDSHHHYTRVGQRTCVWCDPADYRHMLRLLCGWDHRVDIAGANSN